MSLAGKKQLQQQFPNFALVMVSSLVMPESESGRARSKEMKNQSCFFGKTFARLQVCTSKHSIFTLYQLCFGKGIVKIVIDFTAISEVLYIFLLFFQESMALLSVR